jgi:hypothetical protein
VEESLHEGAGPEENPPVFGAEDAVRLQSRENFPKSSSRWSEPRLELEREDEEILLE